MTDAVAGTRRIDTGTDRLHADVVDEIAWITFDNQAKHNALSFDMQVALAGVLRAIAADDSVRVVVTTGAGEKAYMSGADISEFGDKRTAPEARAAYDEAASETAAAWRAVGQPIIAAVRGYCMGAGMITAMQADVRIAADDAQFAIPAARLGLGYGVAGVDALVDLVGSAWAAEILFSARRLDASEALHIGLVNRVVAPSELREHVANLASTIAANAPLTIAACKAAIVEHRKPVAERDRARLAAMVDACFASDDYREGQRAFAEKRPPRFIGR